MKTLLLLCLWMSSIAVAESQKDRLHDRLRVGDDVEQMTQRLGEPNGFMETASQAVYYFDRGKVYVKEGKIIRLDLISEDTLAKQKVEQAEHRRENLEEGRRKKAEVLENEIFATIAPQERVKYWQQFQQAYPGVDVSIPLAKALTEAREEAEDDREARRMVSLEQRVREADRRLELAELKAERALRNAEFDRAVYRAQPVVVLPGISRPYPIGTNTCPIYGTTRTQTAVHPGITGSVRHVRGDASGRFTLSYRGQGIFLNELD